MSSASLYRLSAFTDTPEGGNPAGVWIGDELPEVGDMLRIARQVGFSETAFVAPTQGWERIVRYYSPEAEVPFCGHATIAAGVKLGQLDGEGEYRFDTAVGEVLVTVRKTGGLPEAELTSVPPKHIPASKGILGRVLATLSWSETDLDPNIPPALAFAGVWHFIIAASTAERLARLDYDFDALKKIMLEANLTTIQLVWRERIDLFHARDPFPVGGVVEDPATGAAAAALGGYLRDAGLIGVPASITVLQGETMGRPSRLHVHVPALGGILVSGTAVDLDSPRDEAHPPPA
jgi:PhzF family phenazine biosynthesis protein